jgi:hypothetical protein
METTFLALYVVYGCLFVTILFYWVKDSPDPELIPNRVRFLMIEAKRIGITRSRFFRNRPHTKENCLAKNL